MVNQTQSNSTRSNQSARFGALALCILTCSLTGCVANWSVLGERIPGGSHPADAACPTCAAPQTAVVPPPGLTQPPAVPPVAGTQPPAVPPVPVVTPVVTAETKLVECEERVMRLEEDIRKRDADLQNTALEQKAIMQNLVLQLQNMQAKQEERARRDIEQFKVLNEAVRQIEDTPEDFNGQSSPGPLQTPPAPEGSQAVNELKSLPPATGSL